MVLCFWCHRSVTFHLTCVYIIFSSVWVAEWPPFGKWLLTRLTICSLCILKGWIWVLIASVPDLSMLFTFILMILRFGAC